MDPIFTSTSRPIISQAIKSIIDKILPPIAPGASLADESVKFAGRRKIGKPIASSEANTLVRALLLRIADGNSTWRELSKGPSVQRALVATFTKAGKLTMDDVQAANLSPERLAQTLIGLGVVELSDDGELAENGEFSKAEISLASRVELMNPLERQLYDEVLRLGCLLIIEHFSRSPNFVARTLVENSRDIGLLKSRQPFDARQKMPTSSPSDFTARYTSVIERPLDQVRLLGMKMGGADRDYRLSTAYVNLSIEDDAKAAPPKPPMKLEDALRGSQRLLMQGPAGCGKTTLLQRLALHIIRGELPETLRFLQGSVPFVLPVRSLAHGNLPSPEDFLDHIYPAIRGEKPDGWASNLLRSGEALVMIDGVDEVPASRRAAIMTWLTDIVSAFPRARYLVTARPSALDGNSHAILAGNNFSAARVQPMSPVQIDKFIARWHSEELHVNASSEVLAASARTLSLALLRRRDLARLATTPLLCAMLCALNWISNNDLPRDRVRLYRDALEMLVERRDSEQEITATPFRLSFPQVEPLLTELAFWMMLEGQRYITRQDALLQLEPLAPLINLSQAPQPSPDQLLTYLIERSGVLQAPSEDVIEFRHPSFQDYLSALRALRSNYLKHILRNANDPLYHDVLIMMVGISQSDQSKQSEILEGVVRRARRGRRDSRALWLLAAACIADVALVRPDLARQIRREAQSLVPPQNLEDADVLASAGEFVLDLLSEDSLSELGDFEAAAVIRVATALDAEQSYRLLRAFKLSSSPAVKEQLLAGWLKSTDPDRYAQEVLLGGNYAGVPCLVPEPGHAVSISDLEGVTSIVVRSQRVTDSFAPSPHVKAVNASSLRARSWDWLSNFPALTHLDLSDTNIGSLMQLPPLPKLEEIDVSRSRLVDLTGASVMPSLRRVVLGKQLAHLKGTVRPSIELVII